MIIDNVNFYELEAQKYWSFPKNYKGDPKVETRNMIFSGDYIGSRKVDGAFYKFIKDMNGNMKLIGRSKGVAGDYLNKIEWVPHLHEFFNNLPNGTCLLGELYFPENEGSKNTTTIMGCLAEKAIARQNNGPKLHYYIFDVLAYNGESLYKKNIEDRITYLYDINIIINSNYSKNCYAIIARYFEGENLWNELQEILMSGGEGIVITKKNTCYQPGKRPARQTLKVKKEIQETIDCFFTGRATPPTRIYTGKELTSWKFWENTRTGEKVAGTYYENYSMGEPYEPVTKPYFYGWAGSLEIGVYREGKIKPIGFLSGLTDEMKASPLVMRGKCIEVTCMEIGYDENGKFSGLRHAKLLNMRPDLSVEDCTWEKFMA